MRRAGRGPGPGSGSSDATPQAKPHASKSKVQSTEIKDMILIMLVTTVAVVVVTVAYRLQIAELLFGVEWKGIAELLAAPWSKRQPSASQDSHGWLCSDSEGENVQKLLDMLQKTAYVSNVELGYFKGVRGLQAARDIPKGHPVLSIPFNQTLSIATTAASTAAAAITSSWSGIEDADIHLDAVALLYEAYVLGARSKWAPYICTIPKSFDMPFNQFRQGWGAEALRVLPDVHRLLQKRQQQVAQYEAMTRRALMKLPGGAARLEDVRSQSNKAFRRMHDWAYLAAGTRTISLDLEETRSHGEQVPLAPGFSWLREFGVLVPALDLANHIGQSSASAYFAVDFSGSGKHGLPKSGKPFFSLMAARDIREGEQITFAYLPEDDAEPNCNSRWLLEYGFIIQDGKPQRDCFTFTASAADLIGGDAADGQVHEAAARIQLVHGSTEGLQDLVALAHQAMPSSQFTEQQQHQAVCGMLQRHAAAVSAQLQRSEDTQETEGARIAAYLKKSTLEVMRGAHRAVADAMGKLEC